MTGINLGNVTDKTMFLRVNFRVLGNSRKVANSAVLSEQTQAEVSPALLKVQKTLLDSPELKAIGKLDGEMRTYLYKKSLPYEMGVYLIPMDLIESVTARMKAFSIERETLVQAFITAYPVLCQKAALVAEGLGILYNPADYPSAAELPGKFGCSWKYLQFMTPGTLKQYGMYEDEMQKAVEQMEQVSQEITFLMRQTLLELVAHLKSALLPNADGKPKRLFASAVTNIQEFMETFKARNITNDSDLEALATEVSKLIHPGVNTDMLKKDESFKQEVYAGMADLTGKLSELVENVPGRKFRET